MSNVIYMQIHKKMYPVKEDIYSVLEEAGCVDILGSVTDIPVLDIPFLPDSEWQTKALISRLKHPEWYVVAGENVERAIRRLIKEVKN